MKTLLLTTTAALFTLSAAFAQEEQPMSLDEAPQAARDAAMQHAGGATLDSVQVDDDEGTRTYEFAGTRTDGTQIEIDVLEDGTIEEIEEEIELSAVPAAVIAALEENAAGFEPSFVERSTRADQSVVYEMEGTMEGREVDIEINEDGSNFSMNDDTAG